MAGHDDGFCCISGLFSPSNSRTEAVTASSTFLSARFRTDSRNPPDFTILSKYNIVCIFVLFANNRCRSTVQYWITMADLEPNGGCTPDGRPRRDGREG